MILEVKQAGCKNMQYTLNKKELEAIAETLKFCRQRYGERGKELSKIVASALNKQSFNQPSMKEKKISYELLEATLNFLAQYPYKDVAPLVQELSKLEDINNKPKKDGRTNS